MRDGDIATDWTWPEQPRNYEITHHAQPEASNSRRIKEIPQASFGSHLCAQKLSPGADDYIEQMFDLPTKQREVATVLHEGNNDPSQS